MGIPVDLIAARRLDTPDFPCIFPCSRELLAEKGWLQTGSSANQSGQERNILCFSEIVAMFRQDSPRVFPVSVRICPRR